MLDTDSGMQMQYMAYAACAVLLLGLDPTYLPVLFGILALVFVTALQVFAPRDGGLLSNAAMLASRLKAPKPQVVADKYEEASILFADMAGSTAAASAVAPADFVRFLDEVFTAFDGLVERHGFEKIKTSGDGYVVVSGVPVARSDHAAALVPIRHRDARSGSSDSRSTWT
jgi:adenylate cyclase